MRGLLKKLQVKKTKKKKTDTNFKYGSYVYISSFFIASVFLNIIFTVQYLRANMLYKDHSPVRHIIVNPIRVSAFDMITDSSVTKFVNNEVSFNNVGYVPANLERLSGEKYIFDSKGNGQLRTDARKALVRMSDDFYKEFERPIVVVSSYRSYNYQRGIKNRGCPDNLCAKAGYSEHQSGLAMDLWDASTEQTFMSNPSYSRYYFWLDENAQRYGFTNTYQKGLAIDGYEVEPWHWRYVGVELASQLKMDDITFAEFFQDNIN